LGAGTFGFVALAIVEKNKNCRIKHFLKIFIEKVAIKKLPKIENVFEAKRILREIRILRNMVHKNIL